VIPAEEALGLAEQRRLPADPPAELTDEETIALGYIDSQIEIGILSSFDGSVFDMIIPADIAKSVNVINALKRRYEAGRWAIGYWPVVEGDMITAFRLVFAPQAVMAAPKAAAPLPLIVPSASVALAAGEKRVLVRMPTRSRFAQAIEVLAAYRSMAGMPITLEVVVDTDDETLTPEALYRLHALGCIITYGQHSTKIEACNGGRVTEWDILVLASDDMRPAKDGWATRIVELFEEHYPHLDGCLHFDDAYSHERVCTLPVMGRRIYDRFGQVYHSDYKSLFCDDEYTEVLQALGRLTYVNEILIEHMHPAAGKAKKDALYLRNDALYAADEIVCKRRREMKFNGQGPGFETPPVVLSILICTFPGRREMLERFLVYLYEQIKQVQWKAEVIIDDKPANSLGEKRQRLLERARGTWLCFVDDDDWIAPDYVERVVTALESDPEADCGSFVGTMLSNGEKPQRFEHSLKYTTWKTLESGLLVRSPNHLNAVRTSIAREVGFSNLTYTEDHDYSKRVLPFLKKEVSTGDAPLYYYFYVTKDAHQGAVQ
jgi:hypothetical protein